MPKNKNKNAAPDTYATSQGFSVQKFGENLFPRKNWQLGTGLKDPIFLWWFDISLALANLKLLLSKTLVHI